MYNFAITSPDQSWTSFRGKSFKCKQVLTENMEELTIRSYNLIKNQIKGFFRIIFRITLWKFPAECCSMLSVSDRSMETHLQDLRDRIQQNEKDNQKSIVETEIKNVEGQTQDIQNITKVLEKKFVALFKMLGRISHL